MPTTMTKSYVFQSLCRLKWGHISIMNEIPLRNDATQKRVLFRVRWGETDNAIEYKAKIQNGDDIKMVHDISSPFFWKIVVGREPTVSTEGAYAGKPAPLRSLPFESRAGNLRLAPSALMPANRHPCLNATRLYAPTAQDPPLRLLPFESRAGGSCAEGAYGLAPSAHMNATRSSGASKQGGRQSPCFERWQHHPMPPIACKN